MAAATRHTRSIYAAEALARATFNDIIPAGDGWCERTVSLQKEFRTLFRLASQRFESLKTDLYDWRDRVRCEDVEFDPEREDDFKAALRACVALSSLLIEKFDIFNKGGLYLAHPKLIGLLREHKREAEKILNTWRSPKVEVELHTVKWDEDQTRQLREILESDD
jgi:hypothetical protein